MSTDSSDTDAVETSTASREDSQKPELPRDHAPIQRHIKIGSQRDAEEAGPSTDSVEQATPAEATVEASSVPEPDESPQREAASQEAVAETTPRDPISQSTPVEPVILPSVNSLTHDIEAELEAALGDASLDELIAAEDSQVPTTLLEPESRHQGVVIKVHQENVFISFGGRHEGVVSLRKFEEPPQPGMELEVVIVQLNDDEGLYELTIPGASIDVGDWSDLSEGVTIEVLVTGHNKGGLECEANKIRGFIPASQIDIVRVEDFAEYVDRKLMCVVTEVKPERRNLVLSHRAVLERERNEQKKKLLEELKVGQTCEGVVSRIQDFGAFVDIGGVDGLVHVSRLSWDRVNHPSDVLTEGQKIKVKVEKIDLTTGRIGLSYRDLLEHPWVNIESKFQAGTVVSGTVSRLADFGAFVRIEAGIEGLIHISELAHHRVHRVSSVLAEGQQVDVKILSIDAEAQRIALSLKALHSPPPSETKDEVEESESTEQVIPRTRKKLKGGTNRSPGGEQFGLNW